MRRGRERGPSSAAPPGRRLSSSPGASAVRVSAEPGPGRGQAGGPTPGAGCWQGRGPRVEGRAGPDRPVPAAETGPSRAGRGPGRPGTWGGRGPKEAGGSGAGGAWRPRGSGLGDSEGLEAGGRGEAGGSGKQGALGDARRPVTQGGWGLGGRREAGELREDGEAGGFGARRVRRSGGPRPRGGRPASAGAGRVPPKQKGRERKEGEEGIRGAAGGSAGPRGREGWASSPRAGRRGGCVPRGPRSSFVQPGGCLGGSPEDLAGFVALPKFPLLAPAPNSAAPAEQAGSTLGPFLAPHSFSKECVCV